MMNHIAGRNGSHVVLIAQCSYRFSVISRPVSRKTANINCTSIRMKILLAEYNIVVIICSRFASGCSVLPNLCSINFTHINGTAIVKPFFHIGRIHWFVVFSSHDRSSRSNAAGPGTCRKGYLPGWASTQGRRRRRYQRTCRSGTTGRCSVFRKTCSLGRTDPSSQGHPKGLCEGKVQQAGATGRSFKRSLCRMGWR